MSTRRYYQASLSLPLLVPLAAALVGAVAPERSGVADVASILVFSGIYGGLPYVVLAAGLLRWWRGRGDREIRTSIHLAPLLMLPLQLVPLIAYSMLSGPGAWTRMGQGILFFGGFVLGLGYLYVLVAEAGFHLGMWRGWIRPSPAPGAAAGGEPAVGTS
ncbi:MAG TPA: hypothetical protein VHG28_05725 [Longimicrobiaceae bacterium]|nr:hypothetical protein [Longimicrobiaceae bacterium]